MILEQLVFKYLLYFDFFINFTVISWLGFPHSNGFHGYCKLPCWFACMCTHVWPPPKLLITSGVM